MLFAKNMARIEIQEVTDENIRFTMEDCTLALANALRRIMHTEIPTLAIEIVQYDKNSTVIPEEMTTDRLGLIPIESSTADKYRYPSDCSCKEYCDNCSIAISLRVSNSSSTPLNVTSKDFFFESNSNIVQVGDSMHPSLITRLGVNQAIHCRCIAIKGKGEIHSKWSPVTAVAFGYDGENKLRHTKFWHEQDINEEWPAPWFAENGVAQSNEELYEEPRKFYFNVEVVQGCLEPLDVLKKAISVLRDKFQQLYNALED